MEKPEMIGSILTLKNVDAKDRQVYLVASYEAMVHMISNPNCKWIQTSRYIGGKFHGYTVSVADVVTVEEYR